MADAKKNDPFGLGDAQAMMGMDPSKMTETFRAMTEKSMEQSKEAYGRMRSAADEATKALESTMENAHQGSLQLSKKALEAMRANADLGFKHLDAMMGAKSFSEVIEMQTGYLRQQAELNTTQAKEIQTISQNVAQEMMKPGKEAFEKASKQAGK